MKTISRTSGRTVKRGSKIMDEAIAGLREMNRELAKGRPMSDFYTLRQTKLDLEPKEHTADSVRAIRESLHVSQAVFAQVLGTSVSTIHAWEQGKHAPPRIARRLLDEIALNPGRWDHFLQEAYRRRNGA